MTAQPPDLVASGKTAGPARWYEKAGKSDRLCHATFLDLHMLAAARRLEDWLATPDATLALILLTDQISRNIFRGTPHMYATDPLARHYADAGLKAGFMDQVAPELRVFFCLPFSHSENLDDQARAVRLNIPLGDPSLPYAIHHRGIIRRFGRFPHRNAILARETTEEEADFLANGGFTG